MKLAKRLGSVLLALVMLLALSVPALAAQEGDLTGGSIIINLPDGGTATTYTIYQILYLESYNASSGAYAYKANSAWEDWLKNQTTYVSIDDQGYVTWVKDADEDEFAKLALEYARDNNIDNDGTASALDSTDPVKFTGLNLGYYLVDSSVGVLCALTTTNPTGTVNDKNTLPSLDKTVEEDSTNKYDKTNDADVGQTVNFQATITAYKGAENYVFHDEMSEGLTFGSVTGITLGDTTVADSYYTVTAPATDGHTFDVMFTQDFCDTLNNSDEIVISYTATVNSDAVIGNSGNLNGSYLDYGDDLSTDFSKTKTYTWSFDVLKYANGDTNNVLADAKFVLYKTVTENGENVNYYAKVESGKLTDWTTAEADATTLTSDTDGKIEISGLDADTYYLHETAAPSGYKLLADDVKVEINPTAGVDEDDNPILTLGTVTAEVENKSGSVLPGTGGIGTTVFYVAGSILVIGAAVLLVTKKRMKSEK